MMTSVSLLLFFACVIMGVGLLQSGERIGEVETQLLDLKTGYNNIVARLNDSVYPTFASQAERPEEVDIDAIISESNAENDAADKADNTADAADISDAAAAPAEAESREEQTAALDEELGIEPVAENVQVSQPSPQPQAAAKPEPVETEPTTYVVVKGDTLTHVSKKFYGTITNVDKIMEANEITDPTRLKIGTTLIIPNP